MNRTDAPAKQPKPFGVNGQREDILPTTPSGDNTASYESGFPPITMILKSAGGLPPKGQDMNQILYELSALCRWASAGALNSYDPEFSSEISGYPKGSVLLGDDGSNIFISTTEANTTNPNSGGGGWLSLAKIIAIASLVGANNKLPYFTGVNTAALTDLTSVGRDIIGKGSIADILTYLGFTSGTGWLRFPSGHILQYGSAGGFESYTIVLPVPYTNTNYIAVANGTGNTSPPDTGRVFVETANVDNGSFTAICINADGTRSSRGIGWIAFGK